MWSINLSKEKIILSRDSKELFAQCFVLIERSDTPADVTVLW